MSFDPTSTTAPWSSMIAPPRLALPLEPYRCSPALLTALQNAILQPEHPDFTHDHADALYDHLGPLLATIPAVALDERERQQLRGLTYQRVRARLGRRAPPLRAEPYDDAAQI